LKPNCYGIPSIFSFKSKVCGACQHFTECQKESHEELLRFGDLRIVANILSQHESFRSKSQPAKVRKSRLALTSEQMLSLEAYPKKVQSFLKAVWSKGKHVEMLNRMQRGENPFDKDGARPFYVAFGLLLRGKASRGDFCVAFMDELGWSYSAAYSQVSMLWHILPALDLAEINGAYMNVARQV
jgi:hypothetical protein